MKILNICYSTPDIGIGHLSRLRNLTSSIIRKKKEIEIEFLVLGNIHEGFLDSFNFHIIDHNADPSYEILTYINHIKPELIIFDLSEKESKQYIGQLLMDINDRKIRIIAVDGLIEYHSFIDLIWVPAFTVDESKYDIRHKHIHYGWDCFLLERNRPIQKWKPGNVITILTGGSDPTGITHSLPNILEEKMQSQLEIHWVKGPYSATPQISNNTKHNWTIFNQPSSLENIIYESNYIFSVYGVSFFESLQHGKPTVVLSPYADKDNLELEKLKSEKVAVIAEDLDDVVVQLNSLIDNHLFSEELSRQSLEKFKKSGCESLADKILGM